MAAAKAAGAQILLQADDNTNAQAATPVLTAAATQHGLPVVFNGPHWGGLLFYAPSAYTVLTRGAEYVDLVVRGIPPAQLLVELVRDFELFVNLAVAQRLGLEIAPSVLARATELFDPTAVRPRRVR